MAGEAAGGYDDMERIRREARLLERSMREEGMGGRRKKGRRRKKRTRRTTVLEEEEHQEEEGESGETVGSNERDHYYEGSARLIRAL